ncbi:MAG: phytoene/squalene synthase family protein [Wenzhouxiangellaceae bacterium]
MIAESLHQEAERTIAKGSKSFATATRLFRPAMRRDVMLLYLWCRYCDDLADGQHLGHGALTTASLQAIGRLRENSLAAAHGRPNSELPFRALAQVCRRHPLESGLIEDHIKGFRLDAQGWRPETLDDVLRYSYYVAGAVGVMMARIMGVGDPATLARASDLGLAFQLTNISRDIVEDARAGRCYLPAEWLREAGLHVEDLPAPRHHDRLWPLVKRLIETAEPYYDSARIGIHALPPRAAWAIATARSVYRDIGVKILKQGPTALARRSTTPPALKFWRIFGGAAALVPRTSANQESRPRNPALWTPEPLRGKPSDNATAI